MLLIGRDDVGAFEAFYDRHRTAAFSLAMRILNDRGLAADATQEAFLGFWRQRARYRSARGGGKSWLLSIVRKRAIDIWRRERKRRTDQSGDTHLAGQPAPADTASQAIVHDERENPRALLAKLPAPQRRVIELAYFGGLSHAEIATRLDLPLGTTKSRMRIGLNKLRSGLNAQQVSVASATD